MKVKDSDIFVFTEKPEAGAICECDCNRYAVRTFNVSPFLQSVPLCKDHANQKNAVRIARARDAAIAKYQKQFWAKCRKAALRVVKMTDPPNR